MPKAETKSKRRSSRTAVRLPASKTVDRRYADLKGRDFMTPAEVRGEAAYLVLYLLLKRIPRGMCLSTMAQAYADADSLGIPEITSEVNALFSSISFSDQG